MTSQEIQVLLEKQRNFYKSGSTTPVKFRIEQLKNFMQPYKNKLYEKLLHMFLK